MTDAEVVFEDDPSVEADDPVWRRIPPGWWTFDHNEGRVRPTSQCFQYSRNKETGQRHPMSVTLGKGLTPIAALAGQSQGFKLVGWTTVIFGVLNWVSVQTKSPTSSRTVWSSPCNKTAPGIDGPTFPVRDRLSTSAQWLIQLSPEEIEQARLRTAL